MGIIRATLDAAHSVLQEQWKEAFFCDALDENVLMARGRKRISQSSANSRADDRVITNGSLLSVADGQAAVVVSMGKVIDVCTEPGPHIFVDESHPGGVKGYFRDVWQRIGFGGGDVQPITHAVYYVNMKESVGNRFITPAPVPVALGDASLGLSIDASVLCDGVYSYRITDPATFYRAAHSVVGSITRDSLNRQIESELLGALQAALTALVAEGMRPSDLPAATPRLAESIQSALTARTLPRFGIEIVSVGISSLYVLDAHRIAELQAHAVLKDPEMAMAHLAGATAAAMQSAAQNGEE